MPQIPQISGKELIKAFQKIGFKIARQRGSHIILSRIINNKKESVTIPNHKVIRKGTLMNGILKPINLELEELKKLLK